MRTTERKHWRNGHTVHGGYFHQYALSLFGYGVLIVIKGLNPKGNCERFTFYRLV